MMGRPPISRAALLCPRSAMTLAFTINARPVTARVTAYRPGNSCEPTARRARRSLVTASREASSSVDAGVPRIFLPACALTTFSRWAMALNSSGVGAATSGGTVPLVSPGRLQVPEQGLLNGDRVHTRGGRGPG